MEAQELVYSSNRAREELLVPQGGVGVVVSVGVYVMAKVGVFVGVFEMVRVMVLVGV